MDIKIATIFSISYEYPKCKVFTLVTLLVTKMFYIKTPLP